MTVQAAGAEHSRIIVDNQVVTIERSGLFSGLRQGRTTTISLREITGVHANPPKMGLRGFIHLQIGGEPPTTWVGASQHPRCMFFDRSQQDRIELVVQTIRDAIPTYTQRPDAPIDPYGNPTGLDPIPPSAPPLEVGEPSILVVSSNPVIELDQPLLDLDREARQIRDALRAAEHGGDFELEVRPAARVDDILVELLETRPTVLHFCGHGVIGGLVVTSSDGKQPLLANPVGLARMLAAGPIVEKLRLLVLNVCLSAEQANFLAQWVPIVIGTLNTVGDEAAIRFAHGLYTGLGSRLAVKDAFDLAVAQAEILEPGSAEIYTWAATSDAINEPLTIA